MRKINPALPGALAVWAFVFTHGAGPVYAEEQISKPLTFAMPACPIKAGSAPPTKIGFVLPSSNPVAPFTASGTVQITDQTGFTVILTQIEADTKAGGVDFARTIKTLQKATGFLTFDKGCTATDPYGSNNCHWDWSQLVTASFGGALQEDLPAGKLILDLKIDNTTPFSFSCPVCGGSCTVNIPELVDDSKFNQIWAMMFALMRFPLVLTAAPHSIAELTDALIAAGLPDGNANSLLAKLQAAQRALDQGNNNTARNLLNAFISEVMSLEADGVVPTDIGVRLIPLAQAVLSSIPN